MRNQKGLIETLRALVELLAEESARNPEFAGRVNDLTADISVRPRRAKASKPRHIVELPDIHAEIGSRGEADFRLWLRDQPIVVLRAVVRAQDLDPTRRTVKWKEVEKLADFIADGIRARLARGSAFIGRSNQGG